MLLPHSARYLPSCAARRPFCCAQGLVEETHGRHERSRFSSREFPASPPLPTLPSSTIPPLSHPHSPHPLPGGLVYVSDRVGEHDFSLLRRLVLPDGSGERPGQLGQVVRGEAAAAAFAQP